MVLLHKFVKKIAWTQQHEGEALNLGFEMRNKWVRSVVRKKLRMK